MRRAERLFRLVNELRSRDVTRADDLAEQFEVSVRTIYRDIANLQASGLPIEGEAGIGYVLRPGFDLPNLTFTHDQIDALAVGLSFVETAGDPVLAAAAREVRAKLQASLPVPETRELADAPFFNISTRADAPPHVDLLRKAIRARLVLHLVYQDGAGSRSERHIRPLALWTFPDGWMFPAWCELRKDFRMFRLDRVLRISATGDQFEEDDKISLAAFLEQDACDGH